jgi:trehalose 6-phosphate synthase/phosphatase
VLPRSLHVSKEKLRLHDVKVEGRLLMVSTRLPVSVQVRGGSLTVRQNNGGLANGLAVHHRVTGGLWIGWPGALQSIEGPLRGELAREFVARRIVPVPLDRDEAREFHDRICNGALWPVLHERLDCLPLRPPRWETYEQVNARFADIIADVYVPGDVIWVHDYQLLRLPALLRQRIPGARIGFSLHTPFPPPSTFQALGFHDQLLLGLLGADLVGFQTAPDVTNFVAALERIRSVGVHSDGTASVGNRRIRLGAFPMGIDVSAFAARAASHVVEVATMTLRATTYRLVVGVDRLDYTDGIPRRLIAFEELLSRYPEWRGKLRLIQLALPMRMRLAAYRNFRREVDELVTRINGKYATPTWTPIQYITNGVSHELLVALYRAADVMLVTPLRDGMNLIAKEFVASRIDEGGVLVLSEFSGAAEDLREALFVNPYDPAAVAHAIRSALVMTDSERRHRMTRLRGRVIGRDVHWWADSFLNALLAH